MKILSILGIILLIVLSIIALLIIASTINHKNKLNNEAIKYQPPGKLVRVNNHKIHVYGAGQGNITLVFLAGHGTCAPIIDFKPLWIKLKNDYRIAVVERAGYGWSERSDGREVTDADWRGLLSNYVSQISFGKYKFFDSGHYIHNEKPEIITDEIKDFIQNLPDR